MKTIVYKSESRGKANHGWLQSFHSFSFANYYNPDRMNFGALRVLNDDYVAPGMGFSKHPHNNMEIVSIPLEGELKHQDSMNNTTLIKSGEVQIMSAGTGVFHSEMNNSHKEAVKFLQIWVMPEKQNITPEYDQQVFDIKGRKNEFQTVVSPKKSGDKGVKINQRAWFTRIDLDENLEKTYTLHDSKNGVYMFLLEGKLEIAGFSLEKRDAIGVIDKDIIDIKALANSSLLLMEVPMTF